jgi:uncharacterized protein (DUF4415 family)
MKQIPSLWGSNPTFITPENKQQHDNLWKSTSDHTPNMHLDNEIIDAFKETGDGWQKRINKILRDEIKGWPGYA